MSKRAKKKKPSRAATSRETLPASPTPREREKPSAWLAAAVLALSIAAVYCPAIDTPLIFDDQPTIVENESLVSLWPLVGTAGQPGPLNPRKGLPTSARPLVNFSFAVNYYFGGTNPKGYHVFNVVLHFVSALLLWAIVRRTLRLAYFGDRFASSAGWLALAVALLWALHPLTTEAVIYITQRTELMVGMFYLGTLYCSLRYWEATSAVSNDTPAHPHGRRDVWLALAVLACLAGMGSKEVMVSAPLMVLLFERTFVAGSLGEALRLSWPLYLGLAATWSLLLFLSLSGAHAGEAGFGLGPPIHVYWFTQAQVLLMYLKLVVWPWPMLIHYELSYLESFGQAWMYVVPVLLIGMATLTLLWRNNPIGYLGTWCFAILAPSSVVPIILEMAAERRMYLPLAALMVLFVVGGYFLVEWALLRWSANPKNTSRTASLSALVALPVLCIALALGLLSARRLSDYDDEKSMWRQVLHYQPKNPMAHGALGILLSQAGNSREAIDELRTAVELRPTNVNALNQLGLVLTNVGQLVEAINVLQRAAELNPENAVTLNLLGMALGNAGRNSEALEKFEQAVRLKASFADARNNLGHLLMNVGRLPEALEQLNAALALKPDHAIAHCNLSRAYLQLGNNAEAIEHAERAVQLVPIYGLAHENLGAALLAGGNPSAALEHFRQAVEIDPNSLNARQNLGRVLAQKGDAAGAVMQIEQAIRIAHSTGREANAQQLEQWLTDYRAELGRRSDDANLAPPVQPQQ